MGCPDGGEDAKSDAKAISTVLTVAPVAVTGAPAEGKDGTTAEKAKPYTVTLPVGTTGNVAVGNIAVSANATPALYSEATFATEAPAAGIALAAAGASKDVYVKVTAQDSSVAYYKVSITISLQPVISTVLDVAPEAVTGDAAAGKDGTEAAKAKPYTVTLLVGSTKTAVKLGDIAVSANATPALYSEATFTTAADATNGITLAAAGTAKDVYVKVTANEIVAYYKVSITITLSPDAGLLNVLNQSITAGSEDGTATAPKTAAITLTAASSASTIKAGDIAVAASATFKLYSNANFTDGEVAGESTISLPVGVTTPVYIKVTAQNGTTALHYKVSIGLPKTVSGYSLKAGEGAGNNTTNAASGVSLASATELDGKVTLKLGGTITATYTLTSTGTSSAPTIVQGGKFEPSGEEAWWVNTTTKPEAGTYGTVFIKGLFDWAGADAKVLAIKHTSHALRLYAGNTTSGDYALLDAAPTNPKITDSSNTKTVYIPATGLPIRWKLYSAVPKDDTFGILVWNGGTNNITPKTATLEIQEYGAYDSSTTVGADTTSTPKSGGYSKTVIVDYSGVTLTTAQASSGS
jgi:hypothetical protein